MTTPWELQSMTTPLASCQHSPVLPPALMLARGPPVCSFLEGLLSYHPHLWSVSRSISLRKFWRNVLMLLHADYRSRFCQALNVYPLHATQLLHATELLTKLTQCWLAVCC